MKLVRWLAFLGFCICVPTACAPNTDYVADAHIEFAALDEAAIAALNTVLPDSPTPEELSYFQGMGPLEYAARLAGEPNFPAWRIRLRLIPQDTGEPDGFSYLVKADHYNLSPALYDSLVLSYGDNADPSLNDSSDHQSFQFTFTPVMSIAADWQDSLTQVSQLPVADSPPCATSAQLQLGCAELLGRQLDGEWVEGDRRSLEPALWESEANPIYSIVRALAQQAGKLEGSNASAFWTDGEIPEGSSEERPWIEVLIDNYAGNGGGYQGLWIERAADDSIRSVMHRIYYDGVGSSQEALTDSAVVCNRGEAAGSILAVCP